MVRESSNEHAGGRSGKAVSPFTVVLVVLALLAAACGNAPTTLAMGDNPLDNVPSLQIAAAPDNDVPPVARAVGEGSLVPTITATTAPPANPDVPVEVVEQAAETTAVSDATATWVATATSEVTHLIAYDSPGGAIIPFEFTVPNPHQFGGPQVLMVTDGTPEDAWVEVQLPIRPNGQTGWIDASLYTFSQTTIRAEVNLSQRSVIVYDGNDIIAQTSAVIGSSATPTPLGTFFITAKRQNPPEESYIGPWALALSAFSEVHETFGGGLPVIAIHGTNRPDQVGEARSNGCLRIPNNVVTLLAELVPLGAPVIISA